MSSRGIENMDALLDVRSHRGQKKGKQAQLLNELRRVGKRAHLKIELNKKNEAKYSLTEYYTPIPDEYYSYIPTLTEAEFRVLSYVFRRTLRYSKIADSISDDQFINGIVQKDGRRVDYGCGVRSKAAVRNAKRGLEGKGLITVDRSTKNGKKVAQHITLTLIQILTSTGRKGAAAREVGRGSRLLRSDSLVGHSDVI